MKGMEHAKTQQVKDLMLDLAKMVITDDWERALKANTDKIGRFLRANEWRLSVLDKNLINSCMSYIQHQKEIRLGGQE